MCEVTLEVHICMDIYLQYYFASIDVDFLSSTSVWVYGLIIVYIHEKKKCSERNWLILGIVVAGIIHEIVYFCDYIAFGIRYIQSSGSF